jgi:hypothetical protein
VLNSENECKLHSCNFTAIHLSRYRILTLCARSSSSSSSSGGGGSSSSSSSSNTVKK